MEERFMREAEEATKQSLCIRNDAQMGAVAVRDGKILSRGWNGAVGKTPCITRGECIRQKNGIPSGTMREIGYCICAEQRIICTAARDGISLLGADMYVTKLPCAYCVRMMIAAGIRRVFYRGDYENKLGREIAAEVGFEMIQV